MNRPHVSRRRSRLVQLVLRAGLLLGGCSLAAVATSGCDSNAEKIEAFCTDFQTAVTEHTGDCEAMAAALEEVSGKHATVRTYGNPDDAESQEAMAGCREGARLIATHCAGSEAVNEALQSLEGQ